MNKNKARIHAGAGAFCTFIFTGCPSSNAAFCVFSAMAVLFCLLAIISAMPENK